MEKKQKKYEISDADYALAQELAKKNKHKRVDKRLQVILLRYEGLKDSEIAERTGYHRKRVSQLCVEFCKVGAEQYAALKYGGNHRSLTLDEETEILNEFRGRAEQGQVVSVQEIKAALDKKRGSESGRGYIYMLLSRHGWRKVLPRSKHPNKASDEAIDASKKLTIPPEG